MSDVREGAAPGETTASAPSPQGNFIWYELMTPDPDGAKAFYDAVVGWDIEVAPSGEQKMDYRMIRRSDGGFSGGVLRITDEMVAHGARPIWLGYVNVDDVDSTVAAIEQQGGKTLMAADIAGVGRIAMVTDPQGAPFYVMKPIPPADKPEAKSDVFSPTELQRVAWNELNTSDPQGARRFYGDRFGWSSDDFMPMGELGEYRFWKANGVQIGAVCGLMGQQHPAWRHYFRVPSIAEAKARIQETGGTVTHGPMEVPGGDHIVIGTDPQGAEFALVGAA